MQVLIARMLGPEGVGRIAYMIWLIEITNLLCCLGLPNSLTRYLAELHGQHESARAAQFAHWVFLRFLLLSLIGAAVLGVLFFHSSQYAEIATALPLLMVLFVARALEAINRADLAGRQRFDLLGRINLAAAVALIVGVGVGAFFRGVPGALGGYLAGAMIPAAYSLTLLRPGRTEQPLPVELRRRVWKFSVHTWLALVVSAFVWSRMEIFFLDRYWNAHEVAMFTVALSFALMVRQVAQLFSGAFMAHFAHLSGDGNHDVIQRQYATATRLMAFLVVPMAFGGAAIMPALIPLLFGPEFAPAVPNAMVLTAGSALAFSTIGSALVYAKERSGFIALGGFLGALLAVAAGVLVVSRFGASGAAWSKLFVQCSMIALGTWFIVRRLGFAFPFGSVGRTLLAGGVCGLATWRLVAWMPESWLTLGVAVAFGAMVYVIAVRFLRVLGPNETHQLKRLGNRLPGRIHRPFALTIHALGSTP